MPVRPIIRLGHPALRTPAQSVPPERLRTDELQQLVEDMVETMRAASGVGLAAPQVDAELQIFIYACEGNERHEEIPLHVVVNPMITPHSRELVYDWEGCLSIPDLRGLVPRHQSIRVQGLDREGRRLDYIASGFEARIIQHEYDHLNGIVFLDRMRDLRSLGYTEEWSQYMEGEDADDTAVG